MCITLIHVNELHSARSHIRITHMGIDLNHFKELHRAHSHVRFAVMHILLKHVEGLHIPYISVYFTDKAHKSDSHWWVIFQAFWQTSQSLLTRKNRSGFIVDHIREFQRAWSNVRIALMGIILKHFFKLHWECWHVQNAWMGMILKQLQQNLKNTLARQNHYNKYYFQTFWRSSLNTLTSQNRFNGYLYQSFPVTAQSPFKHVNHLHRTCLHIQIARMAIIHGRISANVRTEAMSYRSLGCALA